MESYNFKKIESKWQEIWEKEDIFQAEDYSEKPKYYNLVEFPFPSGEGLHIGHCRSYIALDILSRKKRMQGFNVLFPIGCDSFGLPAENYAIKTGIHPSITTQKNASNFRNQEKRIGLSFDWAREIDTSDPSYYKWTQWIFIQLFNHGLAYKAKIPINWCPACKIGLANEEVINDSCERCGAGVVKKEKEQWMLRITEYAERLIDDLDLVDYPEKVKISQKEWIGRSEGWRIKFELINLKNEIEVFTTRVDTLFGASYLVLAPENPIIKTLSSKILNFKEVLSYIEKAKQKTELERISETKEKTGVELKGIKAINPVNNKEIPIFVSDYVLMNYGTGAIMAVPAHDQRDFDFSSKYNLPVIKVIESPQPKKESIYEGEGILINSEKFNGLSSEKAKEKIGEFLSKKQLARKTIFYKLRDWVFSRQRYWGEPIPMIFCEKCASIRNSSEAGWSPLKKEDLPLKLPKIKDFKPTHKGESPLASASHWIKTTCPRCGEPAKRETDVMPNWAGSNWYYLRYCDPHNNEEIADPKKLEYWLPVDWYNGGMEHTTLHLLYSRFIYKFLWDIGVIPKSLGPEPYKKRTSHGMVLGEGGIKMSKSKGNVVNPDEVIKEYGADTLRIYEMFMGPFEQSIPWDVKGLIGAKRFLEKVWKLQYKTDHKHKEKELDNLIHKTIKKVGEDIENLKFNTAISSLMILVNEMEKQDKLFINHYSLFLIILNPFVPHITEEIWSNLQLKGFCYMQKWPKYKDKLIKEEKVKLIIQVNGKVRDTIQTDIDISKEKAEETALSQEKIKKWVKNKKIKNIIFVPKKLINIVI